MQQEIANVAKACQMPGFRYVAFAPVTLEQLRLRMPEAMPIEVLAHGASEGHDEAEGMDVPETAAPLPSMDASAAPPVPQPAAVPPMPAAGPIVPPRPEAEAPPPVAPAPVVTKPVVAKPVAAPRHSFALLNEVSEAIAVARRPVPRAGRSAMPLPAALGRPEGALPAAPRPTPPDMATVVPDVAVVPDTPQTSPSRPNASRAAPRARSRGAK